MTTATHMSHGRSGDQLRPSDRDRILDAARQCFLEAGYAGTTVDAVADRAGVDSAAVSRCYRSERELFLAVADHVEGVIYDSLRLAAGKQPTFAAAFEATLDGILVLCRKQPSAARYLIVAENDFVRRDDLHFARAGRWPGRQAFVAELVEIGMATREVPRSEAALLTDTLTALLAGVWHTAVLAPRALPGAIEGLKRAMTGLCP